MKITLLVIGKNQTGYLDTGIADYTKRLKRYVNFNLQVLPNAKAKLPEQQQEQEAEKLLKYLQSEDYVVLLDERGEQRSSENFAQFIEKRMNASCKHLVFIIGGAYGFHQRMYERANSMLSLSKMTFTHDMVRLFFHEQLYRAFTILRNEKYHH